MATTDRKIYTLVSVLKDDEILLGLKKRGFGVGWWNGFGGKINNGETIEEAAKRCTHTHMYNTHTHVQHTHTHTHIYNTHIHVQYTHTHTHTHTHMYNTQ